MRKLTILLFCVFVLNVSKAQVVFNINTVPALTPENDTLYLAGSFNQWSPNHKLFAFSKIGSQYFLTLNNVSGNISCKITRGSWQSVEANNSGGFIPNRNYNLQNNDTVFITVLGWEDQKNGSNSTALDNVKIVSEQFFMPQLNRTRKVQIYLPNSYDVSGRRYPVVYMHDGQNLFDIATSFAGEWGVDETLSNLEKDSGDYGCIIVGIDNGGAKRIDEYTPYVNPQYGGGEGEAYMDFLVQTLKPFIDSAYRTLPEREYTGIAGSSLGGLISLYGALKHQAVFSKVGIFSPAYWIVRDSLTTFVQSQPKLFNIKSYSLAGSQESASMVQDMYNMDTILKNKGFETTVLVKTDGEHKEWFWNREFKDCYKWLFNNTGFPLSTDDIKRQEKRMRIIPNPANEGFTLTSFPLQKLQILDYKGKVFAEHNMVNHDLKTKTFINTQQIPNGNYLVKCWLGNEQIITLKLVVQH